METTWHIYVRRFLPPINVRGGFYADPNNDFWFKSTDISMDICDTMNKKIKQKYGNFPGELNISEHSESRIKSILDVDKDNNLDIIGVIEQSKDAVYHIFIRKQDDV